MTTFAQDLKEAAKPERIKAVQICSNEENYGFRESRPPIPHEMKDIPLSWGEARPLLNYTYDSGFGSQDCHQIFMWTLTRVFYIHVYDGSTSIKSAPRSFTPKRSPACPR